MGRNAKGTRGYSVPRAERGRRGREITLSDAAWAKLDRLAGTGRRSAYVEALIMNESVGLAGPIMAVALEVRRELVNQRLQLDMLQQITADPLKLEFCQGQIDGCERSLAIITRAASTLLAAPAAYPSPEGPPRER